MSVLLAIDTAAPRLGLAILRGDHVDVLDERMATGQAERLMPAIAELLDRNGLAYSDLQRVVVTTGPGSFTGLRIGLSAARGLGLALGIPVLGIDSLGALSLLAPPDLPVVVLIDAKRGEMYRQEFMGPIGYLHDAGFAPTPLPDVFRNIGPAKKGLEKLNPFVKFSHLLGSGAAAASLATGATDLEASRPESERGFADMALLARWAATADPKRWPPEPTYGRDADAKPQEKFRVARTPA